MTPSLHHGRSRAFAIEAAEHDEEYNKNTSSNIVRRSPQQSTPSRPITGSTTPVIGGTPPPPRTGSSSGNRAQQQHSHHHHHHHHLPLNVLLSGWTTKLEAVQRWVLDRITLEYIPHPHYYPHLTSSAAVQRVLKDDELVQLEAQYKDQIKVDPEYQALQKQIRTMRQQLHDKKRERERLEKKHVAQREREQKALDALAIKLKQALEATEKSGSSTKSRREYDKALQRAGHRKNQSKRQNSFYKKIIAQPLTAIASSSSSTASNTNWATGAIEEKEALTLETTILRNMHQTLVYQNQCDVAQKYDQEITSSLKRSRALVDNDKAEINVFQMVLEGTTHALAGLYPEIVSRQENLMERLSHGNMTIVPRRSIPRVIVPKISAVGVQQKHHHKRFSFTSSVNSNGSSSRNNNNSNLSISDLGESDDNSSTTNKEYYSSYDHDAPFATSVAANGYSRSCFPVFTSVETLQQQTLQHLAGV